MSLYSLTNSFNKYLLTSTLQALFKAPGGCKMERRQLSFYIDYNVIPETDMQNIFFFFLQYSKLPPQRYSQSTERTCTSTEHLPGVTGPRHRWGSRWAHTYPWPGTCHADSRQREQQVCKHQRPGGLERSKWRAFLQVKGNGDRSRRDCSHEIMKSLLTILSFFFSFWKQKLSASYVPDYIQQAKCWVCTRK